MTSRPSNPLWLVPVLLLATCQPAQSPMNPEDEMNPEDACYDGDPRACFRAGLHLMQGGEVDRLRSYHLLAIACEHGVPDACADLGPLSGNHPVNTQIRQPATPSVSAAPSASEKGSASERRLAEECIATLRISVSADDPSNAGGEAEYRSGLTDEAAGDRNRAGKEYLKVIQHHPRSAFAPATYFAFGEIFEIEASRDPSRWLLAEQSFNEVLRYPAPSNKLRRAAWYRLGILLQSHDRPPVVASGDESLEYLLSASSIGDKQQALKALVNAARADRNLQDECAAATAAAALTASLPVFGDIGDPAKAWDFYMDVTGDTTKTAMRTLELIERYINAQKFDSAATCLAASAGPGAKALSGPAHKDYCTRIKATAQKARAGNPSSATLLDSAITGACQ